ncbi:MAG TPA: helix-turn-helix domain-containing protein [Ktedonobacteraceae bacterium]
MSQAARSGRDVKQAGAQDGRASSAYDGRPQTAQDYRPASEQEHHSFGGKIPEGPAAPSMVLHSLRSRMPPPSVSAYGSIVIADGFTQHPRSVEDYLNTLDLCPSEKNMLLVLESHRRQADQECFPSVCTLAKRCCLSCRRVHQITAHLSELGLIVKRARFAAKRQLSNYYDLEPLYEKVAAWKDAEVAQELARQQARTAEPFVPIGPVEEVAQAVSEEFGEPATSQILYNARRISRRLQQHSSDLNWHSFLRVMVWAERETAQRSKQPTNTNKTFQHLVSYFFSALDYQLACQRTERGNDTNSYVPLPEQEQFSSLGADWETDDTLFAPTEQTRQEESVQWEDELKVPPTRWNEAPTEPEQLLPPPQAQTQAYQRRPESKVPAPGRLKCCIEAAALTFRDHQTKSSIRRATNLMARAGLAETTMCQLVADARAITSQSVNVRHRMPYFFSVLEELVNSKALA